MTRIVLKSALLAACILISGAPHAFAAIVPETPPSIWNPGSWGLSATSEYFTSNSNYDSERGSFSKLPNGNEVRTFENTARARYGFTHLISAFGGVGFTQSTAVDTVAEKTNTGLTHGYLGANLQWNRRWWRVVPEVEVGFPIDKTDPNQTVPLTSDGVPYLRAGVFLFKPYKRFRFESYLGFHAPGEDLAKRFMYALSGELAFVTGFSLGGGIAGYETVLSDGKTQAQREFTTTRAMAGSHRYWAYNPALLEARVWLGFRADRAFSFRLGYGKTINGVRAADGQTILLSVAYNSPGDRAAGKKARARSFDPEVPADAFEPEEEKVDEELFQPEKTQDQPRKSKKGDALDDAEKLLETK